MLLTGQPDGMSKNGSFQFFEGPEKKVELHVKPAFPSLRAMGEERWRRVVAKAQAFVISVISNAVCDAYLLSESSLFVYDDRIVMITCGRTTLVNAVEEMLSFIPVQELLFLFYERKNAHFPEYQPSNFYDDLHVLRGYMPGRAFRFGDEDDHHIYVFHLQNNHDPIPRDMTLEILMHGIDERAKEIFCSGSGRSLEAIEEKTLIREIFPGFTVDDHLFEPAGYSLNAIHGAEYYTVHVTPQDLGSYVSFETNHCVRSDLDATVRTVLDIFKPSSCDILFFQPHGGTGTIRCEYQLRKEVFQRLECGYEARFYHYFRPPRGVQSAEELEL